jgi:regulator of cell morphogenesis and NO signaling
MQTRLNVEQANCPICFGETLDALCRIDGVRAVHGSIAGSSIEIDHDDVSLDVLVATVRDRLHGVVMFSSEIEMVPVDAVVEAAGCVHGQSGSSAPQPVSGGRRPDSIHPSMTLSEIVTRHPSLAAALESRGLDYCCHGTRTLQVAAAELGLDPWSVADQLSTEGADDAPASWASLAPSALVDDIESVHHRYLWSELPRITALVDKIVAAHVDRHPELAAVQRLFGELRTDLEPHLVREEQTLFPAIRELDAPADGATPHDADLAALTRLLEADHETVGALLAQLRHVTGGYTTPTNGCASYAACYRALAELEADTHLHVHKENNALLPAVRASLLARPTARGFWTGPGAHNV